MGVGALVACGGCGFVTRRHSRIGAEGKCPNCRESKLVPVSFSAARKLQLRKRELERLGVRMPSARKDRGVSP
jgi:hypothetical protein